MSSSEPKSLEVGTILGERFKIEAPLPDTAGSGAYSAHDQKAGEPCLLAAVSEQALATLRPFLKVRHAHLAPLLAIEKTDRGFVAASSRVEGTILGEQEGDIEPVVAVRSALRIADAMSTAHAAGALHGRIHPGAVVWTPEGSEGPMLCLAGVPPTDSPYRSPERGDGPASEADDAWAVAALLFKMLTGEDPPPKGVENEEAFTELGVSDPVLRTCLWHALNADTEARNNEIRPFKRALARWFVDHEGEDALAHSHSGSLPPPLPSKSGNTRPAAPAIDSNMTLRAQKSSRRRLPVLAVGGLAVGLAAAWAASMLLAEPAEPVVLAPPEPSAKPTASADAIDLGEVAVQGEERDTQTVVDDKLSSCVMGYLPKETFGKPTKLDWACQETSARAGADKLRSEVVARAPHGTVSAAMRLFSKMGAYDQLAYSVVRAGCCPDAKPLKFPEPSAGCGHVDEIAAAIGKQVVDGQDYQASLSRFSDALACENKAGRGAEFRGTTPEAENGKEAFVEYVAEFEKSQ